MESQTEYKPRGAYIWGGLYSEKPGILSMYLLTKDTALDLYLQLRNDIGAIDKIYRATLV